MEENLKKKKKFELEFSLKLIKLVFSYVSMFY